jgi:predicted RNA-binding Zn-ribbon protein involved in translation (DUF1610 family)
MSKAAKWLQEERRRALGDWAAFCLDCGVVRRWFDEFEAEVPAECPACGGQFVHRCRSCNEPFSSAFAVDCESCGAPLRKPELFGTRIRKE